MKKAIIYVFTGTGNTRIAADHIAQALAAHDITATVWEARVPFSAAPDPNGFDIAGFGYPIHAFNTPQFFLRFAKTLPKANNIPAFIFKTSGEPFRFNNASSRTLVRILRKKGFVPMLDTHLLMPYNIMFRYKDALVKQMYRHTHGMAGVIADQVAAAQNHPNESSLRRGPQNPKLRYHPLTALLSYVFRLQWFGAWINGPMIHAKKPLCTSCGVCVKTCPAGNIRLKDGIPRFSYHCTMCMGCVFKCPTDAIRPGFLNPWRVNGAYPFDKLADDDSVPDTYVDETTKGYFRLFRRYYDRTYAQIRARENTDRPS